MNFFLRSFWFAFAVCGFSCFLGVHLWWRTHLAGMPSRPPFPARRDAYVAAYGDSGYTVHYLYRFGLFGLGDRIRHSAVLLFGPSHVELGLSAAQLSADLSAKEGHPVRVYNLGIGYGDSLPFDREILAANNVRGKAAVIDLYLPNGGDISAFGQKAEKSSRISAYLYVTDLWARAAADWCLDPWLPNLRTEIDSKGQIELKPARLLRSFILRNWSTGDTIDIWRPQTGFIYRNSPSAWNLPFRQADPAGYVHAHDLFLTPAMQAALEARQIQPVYTLIPYDGYLPGQIPDAARPYVPISSENLGFIDTNHLNAASRDVVTTRLFLGIMKENLLSSWLRPPPSP